MTDLLAALFGAGSLASLTTGDYIWLSVVALLSGLVRGFSGFGTALIYIPLASLSLPPLWVLVTLTAMDLIGPLPNVPRALREGRPRQVALIGLVAAATLPFGLMLLDVMSGDVFRWLVAALCLLTVALLASGWRWSGRMTPMTTVGVGAVSGFLGGVSGLSGPPVVLTYMSTSLGAAVIRANLLLYLVLWDIIFAGTLWVQGRLELGPVALGLFLAVPYLAANVAGARLFRPDRERAYRAVAYVIVTGAALTALPIWSGP